MPIPLKDVPESIKNYLGSEKVMRTIQEIARKARISNTSSISSVLFLIETKETKPENFVKEVISLSGTTKEMGYAVAREVREKILRSISHELSEWGFDIEKIEIPKDTSVEEVRKKETEFLKSRGFEEEKIFQENSGGDLSLEEDSPSSQELPTAPISWAAKPEASTGKTLKVEGGAEPAKDGPLILHRENTSKEKSYSKKESSGSKGFTLPFGMFKNREDSSRDLSDPIRASVETPPEYIQKIKERTEGMSKKLKSEKKRIVHYNELRTPLTPFSKEGKFIKTDSFQKKGGAESPLQPQASKQPLEKPTPFSQPPEKKPSEGFVWFNKKKPASRPVEISETSPKPEPPKPQPIKKDFLAPPKPALKTKKEKGSSSKQGGVVWFNKDKQKKQSAKEGGSPTVEGNTIDLREKS